MRDKLNGLVNKYHALRAERDAGRISDEEYERQLEGSAVADGMQEGCWWNISPESGLWIFFDGSEWTQKAPDGFDPMVSTGPAPTVQRPVAGATGGGKSLAWLWILLVVVAVGVGTTVAVLIALNSGGSSGGANAEERIEEVIEDFYKAAEDADFDDLSPLITAGVADDMEDAESDGELEDILRPYEDLDVEEINDIEIDGEEATATAILERDGRRTEQEIELELDGGNWRIADLGAIDAGGGRRSVYSGDVRADVRNFLEDFMQAFKRYDIDTIKALVAPSVYPDMDLDDMEEIRTDPERLASVREYMQGLTWEIYDLEVAPSGDSATALIKINLASNPQRFELERRGGVWMIVATEEIEP